MAFKPISNESFTLPEVPFLNNYPHLKKKNGEIFDVLHILESEKGLILFTTEFKVFLWNNESAVKPILETVFSASVGSTYSQVQVMLDPTLKKLCQIGIEDGVFVWENNGKVWSRVESTSQTSLPNLGNVENAIANESDSKKKR